MHEEVKYFLISMVFNTTNFSLPLQLFTTLFTPCAEMSSAFMPESVPVRTHSSIHNILVSYRAFELTADFGGSVFCPIAK